MDNYIRISSCVVSHMGMGYSINGDNFFVNGRSRYEYETGNIQVSLVNSAAEHMFAISDGMDRINDQQTISISMATELRKFQDNVKGKGGDVKSKMEQMSERVTEINNVIFSMTLNKSEDDDSAKKENATAFAGLMVMGREAAVICLGGCRIYLLRDDKLKNLTGDNNKTDRLLRMEIITDEQAKELSNSLGKSYEELKCGIYKSNAIEVMKGDLFLFCSDGLYEGISDDGIFEILYGQSGIDMMSNMLVGEAIKSGVEDNITSLVIKIDEINEINKPKGTKDTKVQSIKETSYTGIHTKIKRAGRHAESSTTKNNNFAKAKAVLAIICVSVVLIMAMITYKPWLVIIDNVKEWTKTEEPTKQPTKQPIKQPTKLPGEVVKPQTTAPTIVGNAATSTGVAAQGNTQYVVKNGDTLGGISLKFYQTADRYQDIMDANKITDPNQLTIGMVLIIPK